MEIYRNRNQTVIIDVPDKDSSYAVKIESPALTTESVLTTDYNEDMDTAFISVPIGFRHTMYDGDIALTISLHDSDDPFAWTEHISVVTPLFTWRDLPDTYNKEDSQELEGLVRTIVESKTSQSFGKRPQVHQVHTGKNVINFEAPLIRFTGISDRYLTDTTTLNPPKIPYEVLEGGFSVSVDWDTYDVKTDTFWMTSNNRPRNVFIYGEFGYERVPEDVKRAALLIAGMWGSQQAVWRDRFVQTIRSSDWNVTYGREGFGFTTGSVTADMLLSKYTRQYHPEVI